MSASNKFINPSTTLPFATHGLSGGRMVNAASMYSRITSAPSQHMIARKRSKHPSISSSRPVERVAVSAHRSASSRLPSITIAQPPRGATAAHFSFGA